MKHPAIRLMAFSAFALGLALPLSCRADDVPVSPILGRTCWELSPEAKALVAEMREQAKGYKPHTDHIALLPRSQVKYGLEQDDYLHRWYDRPLQQDSSFKASNDVGATQANWRGENQARFERQFLRNNSINPEGWKVTAQTVKLGKMDGQAVCLAQSGRSFVIPRSVMPGGEMTILVELPYGYAAADGMASYLRTVEKAVNMTNAYRIDGKIVLTRYPEIKENDLPFYAELRKAIVEKYGDRFILLPYMRLIENSQLPDGPLTAKNIEISRDRLRRILRVTDGFFHSGRESFGNSRYDPRFADEVMTPLVQSVLMEPEFRGKKYLGVWVTPGHENCYRWQYVLDSTGTRMMRGILGAVKNLRPDFCILCEWDEENENTMFRPMFSTAFSTQRITRFFADDSAGRAPEPFPNDNPKIPNLCLSYRKTLIAGEPLEAELLNIPDGSFKGQTFTVTLAWRDAEGRVVKAFPAKTLAADKLDAVWFNCPVSSVVTARTLVPEVSVSWKGGSYVRADGFWPVSLEATRTVEFKWVKQPLRDLADAKGALAVSPRKADGTVTVTGSVSSDAKLRTIEVLENMTDTVYMFDPTVADAAKGKVVVKLQMQGLDCAAKTYQASGKVTWPGGEWEVKKWPVSNWFSEKYVELPADAAADAVIDVDLPPVFRGKIRVADVIVGNVVSLTGPGGASFVATHFLSARAIPAPANVKEASFAFDFKPVRASEVLAIQVSDENFRLWRSKPVVCETKIGRMKSVTVHERVSAETSTFAVDAVRVEEPAYDFADASRGGVVPCATAGRALWGILGAKASLVTGFGMGETQYGNQIARYIRTSMDGWTNTQPQRVEGALRFTDCNFVGIPQQVVPDFADFTLSMRVKPERTDKKMTLLSEGNQAIEVSIGADGTVTAYLFGGRRWTAVSPKGPAVRFGAWNDVKVVRRGDRVWVEVEGVAGTPCLWPNYLDNSRWTTIGGAKDWSFFRGEMAGLNVEVN